MGSPRRGLFTLLDSKMGCAAHSQGNNKRNLRSRCYESSECRRLGLGRYDVIIRFKNVYDVPCTHVISPVLTLKERLQNTLQQRVCTSQETRTAGQCLMLRGLLVRALPQPWAANLARPETLGTYSKNLR